MENKEGVYIGQNTILDVGFITEQPKPISSTNTIESLPVANLNSNLNLNKQNSNNDPKIYVINSFLSTLSNIFKTNYNKPPYKPLYIKLKDNLLKIMIDIRENTISPYSIKYDPKNFITYEKIDTIKIDRRKSRAIFDMIITALIENTDAKTKMSDFRNLLITNTNQRISKKLQIIQYYSKL